MLAASMKDGCENHSLTTRVTDVGSQEMHCLTKKFSLNYTVKKKKGILFAIVILHCFVLVMSLQSAEQWKPLFNGKDFMGWTVPGRDGQSLSPADAGWKIESGALIGGQAGSGHRGESLVSQSKFKDVELQLDFILAEEPAAPDGSCSTCTYNSGVYLRNGYQVNFGRREAGEFIGVVVHRVHPKAIKGNVLWLDTGDEKFPNLRKKGDWNHVEISFKGQRLQVTLNGTRICDVTDDPTDPAEAAWKEAGPISFQWPHGGAAGGFAGFVKFRNVLVRDL
jgi:hypothetical protein